MAEFTETGSFSPNGRYFVAVTERGLLPEGVTEATVWLFESSAVRQSLDAKSPVSPTVPIVLARLTATINGGEYSASGTLITRLTWESDSESLLFLGHDGRENRQLFRVDVRDRKMTALTPSTQDVVDYGAGAGNIVYLAGPEVTSEKLWWSVDPSAPDIVAGTGQPLMHLLYPNYEKNQRAMPTSFGVWRIKQSGAEQIIDAATKMPMRILGSYNLSAMMTLSPSGTRMIAIAHADQIPSQWQEYQVPSGLDYRPFHPDPSTTAQAALSQESRENDYTRALQYHLFDLEKGSRHPLLTAPLADFQRGGTDSLQAAWSPDGHHVAVSGTYLPLDGTQHITRSCGITVVDVRGGEFECLTNPDTAKRHPVYAQSWDSTQRLLIQSDGPTLLAYERSGSHWQLSRQHPRPHASPLDLTIQQDLNEPPVLFAKDPLTGRGRKIFDPNPQLANINLGTVSPYTWRDAHGRMIRGGLAKPPDFVPGHRYPLVIQTHGFASRQFFRVGYSETSNAGRSLAGRGMLVLQVAEPRDPFDGTWQEGTENGVNVYLAAIDQLVAEGLVDTSKVGITGYSRMGFYVAKAITDAPDRFAAAVLANADPGSLIGYDTYIDYIMPTYAKNAADLFAGSPPYGDGLQKWFERAPGFRTDKIRAPVLISAADPQHLISLWGIYAPLRDQGKPVELQYIRSGQHNLTKPLQRLAHQEMLVDWFDFWLRDYEEPAGSKAAQYARWRKLRAARDAAPTGTSN